MTVDIRKVKTFQIHVMFISKFCCKKKKIFLFFCESTPLGLDKIIVDCLISVILQLWNRLHMSDKCFKFFMVFIFFIQDKTNICSSIKEFISIFLDFETCTISLAQEVLQFCMHYYMYQENLFAYPHHILSQENPSHIFPLRNDF